MLHPCSRLLPSSSPRLHPHSPPRLHPSHPLLLSTTIRRLYLLQPLQAVPRWGQVSLAIAQGGCGFDWLKIAGLPHMHALAPAHVVVLAVVAFLAWRPRSGWLRRKPAPLSVEDGKDRTAAMNSSAVQAGPAPEVDTLLPYSVAVLDTQLQSCSASSAEPALLQSLVSGSQAYTTPAAVDPKGSRSSRWEVNSASSSR